jgi:hypothetical protein
MTFLFVAILLVAALAFQRQIRFLYNVYLWRIPFYLNASVEEFRFLKRPIIRAGLQTFLLNECDLDSESVRLLLNEKTIADSCIKLWPNPIRSMSLRARYPHSLRTSPMLTCKEIIPRQSNL